MFPACYVRVFGRLITCYVEFSRYRHVAFTAGVMSPLGTDFGRVHENVYQ